MLVYTRTYWYKQFQVKSIKRRSKNLYRRHTNSLFHYYYFFFLLFCLIFFYFLYKRWKKKCIFVFIMFRSIIIKHRAEHREKDKYAWAKSAYGKYYPLCIAYNMYGWADHFSTTIFILSTFSRRFFMLFFFLISCSIIS